MCSPAIAITAMTRPSAVARIGAKVARVQDDTSLVVA